MKPRRTDAELAVLDRVVADTMGERPLPLEVCGDLLGVSRERIRQIEQKALLGLRIALRQAGLTEADLCADEREVWGGTFAKIAS